MHGYELSKQLNMLLGSFRALSLRLAVPLPEELYAEGLIAEEATSRRGQPVGASARPVQDRLPAHRRGQGAVPGPARRPGPRPGTTTSSASTSRSSARPPPTSGCGSSRAGAAGSRSGWRACGSADAHRRASGQLHARTPAARARSVEREVRWLNELIADGTAVREAARAARTPTLRRRPDDDRTAGRIGEREGAS